MRMRTSAEKAMLLVMFLSIGGLSSVSLLSGCASMSVDADEPAELYKQAEQEIDGNHYQVAIEKLRNLKNKFPYSKYAVDAQLRLADVYFMQESYTEAAASYESFRDLHPKHEKTPYAIFRMAKSYYNDTPGTVARDLLPATRAIEAYNEFLRRYPNAPEADEARHDLNDARNSLASKELYIGDFYYKRGFYPSAKPRYKKVIELYPETEAAKTAKEKIAQIDERLKSEETSSDQRNAGNPK